MAAAAPSALVDLESELEILAACMYAPLQCEVAFERLSPGMFADAISGKVFGAIADLHRLGSLPAPALIRDRMGNGSGFEAWGGIDLLARLVMDAAPGAIAQHVGAVVDRYQRRGIRTMLDEGVRRVGDLSEPLGDILQGLERGLTASAQAAAPDESTIIDAQAAGLAALDHMDEIAVHGRQRGLMTGLRCFDYRCRGLQPGHLLVVAGRPSMGKTALARNGAMGAAIRNPDHRIVFFTLEMDREELSHRNLSDLSYIHHGGVRAVPYFDMQGVLHRDDRQRLRAVFDRLPPNFSIEDAPVISLDHIRRRLRALKRRGPIGAAFIDYLQIMQRPDARGRNESSVIGEITQGLKSLARELDICIVLLSQLNRSVESRDDKVPQLSDLRESGSIEQDANAVLLCFREAYYLEKKEPREGGQALNDWQEKCSKSRRDLDVYVAKIRSGPTGRDRQTYLVEFDHIEDEAPAGGEGRP